MIPPNAHSNIQRCLIEDFLAHGNCKNAEYVLRMHFWQYEAEKEIGSLVRTAEDQLANMMDDCVILIAAAAKPASIVNLIRARVKADHRQATRLFAMAQLRWSSQHSTGLD